jgi:hypothetical protein
MPRVIGKGHNLLMENYFREWKSSVIEKEYYTYAQHKKGYCIKVKLFVRQMLDMNCECVQYVGLLVKVIDDNEYIITDTRGVISSMTDKLAFTLNIKHQWFTNDYNLQIQLLAPELGVVYESLKVYKDKKGSKFNKVEGDELVLVIPEGFNDYMNNRDTIHAKEFNNLLKYCNEEDKYKKPQELFRLRQYRNSSYQAKVKCRAINYQHIVMNGKCILIK